MVSYRLVTADVEYVIVLDQQGIDLGKQMLKRTVEVTGVVTVSGDQKLITVQSFRPQIIGLVDAIITPDGRVTLVKLASQYGTFVVILDEKGVELGRLLNGRKAVVVGTVVENRGREKQFLIKTYCEYGDRE